MTKEFDLIIYGATGFTGKLAAKYVTAKNKSENLKIAIAGRNRKKLEEVLNSCEVKPKIIVADSTKPETIDEMVKKTKVILSFAGPFTLYGEPIIAACAEHGVDYLDITGETLFIRSMIEKYQDLAKKTGATLIPFSGFDSVPADLSMFLAMKEAKFKNLKLDEYQFYYKARGGFNGGTLATALHIAKYKDKRDLYDPNLLVLDGKWPKIKADVNLKPYLEKYFDSWAIPFFMSPINTAVVKRSAWLNAKLGDDQGKFRYSELLLMGKYWKAFLGVLTLATFGLLTKSSFGRKIIAKLGPKPGEGPSDEVRNNGFFKGQLLGKSDSKPKLVVSIESKGDPGNNITVALAVESALLAAQDSYVNNLKGFVTPSIAFGDKLVARLKDAGFKFSVTVN